MAAGEAAQAHPNSAGDTVFQNGVHHVFGTSRIKPAGGGQQRGEPALVRSEDGEDYGLHRRKTRSTSLSRNDCGTVRAERRRFQTIFHPGLNSAKRWRIVSRRRRFIRLRSVALPKALGVVKPTLEPSKGSGFFQQKATKHELGTLKPSSYTLRNSTLLRMRRDFGKVSRGWAEGPGLGVGVADCAFVTDGELMAATGAAASENGAAILRSHSGAEAVLLRTLVIVRLKCSFRHAASLGWPNARKGATGHKDTSSPCRLNSKYRRVSGGCQSRHPSKRPVLG